jgi:hypothetical protein
MGVLAADGFLAMERGQKPRVIAGPTEATLLGHVVGPRRPTAVAVDGGGRVWVRVRRRPRQLTLEVEDEGPADIFEEAEAVFREDLRRNPGSAVWRQSVMFDHGYLATALLMLDFVAPNCTQRPRCMASVPAVKKLLAQTGLTLAQMDVIELNEAFAAQGLAVLRELGVADDDIRINPNGGAIALGHPLGMSGARLITSAVVELEEQNKRYALCTMCIGVGQGIAMIIERVA